MFESANPRAAYEALPTEARAAFDAATQPAGEIDIQQTSPPSVMADGCWEAYTRFEQKALAGNTIYTWWIGVNWCGKGGNITSYKIYTLSGETSTPGWSYQGVQDKGARNLTYEVRQYGSLKFTFGISGWGKDEMVCAQIRSAGGGPYWDARASCNLN